MGKDEWHYVTLIAFVILYKMISLVILYKKRISRKLYNVQIWLILEWLILERGRYKLKKNLLDNKFTLKFDSPILERYHS